MKSLKTFRTAWRRPGCAVLAVLTGCLLFGTAAAARADLATRTHALHTTLARTPAAQRTVNAQTDYPLFATRSQDPGADLNQETGQIYTTLAPTLPLQPIPQAWADLVATPAGVLNAPASAIPPHGTTPELTLDYRQNLPAHTKLVAGRLPTAATTSADGTTTFEAAATRATLTRYSAHLGSTISFSATDRILITAVVAPADPADAFWQSRPTLAAPILDTPIVTPPFWNTAVFVGAAETDALTLAFPIVQLELSWTFPLATDTLTPAALPPLANALTTTFDTDALAIENAGATGDDLRDRGAAVTLTSDFTPTVVRFLNEQTTEELETAMPTASLAVIGLIALILLSRAAVDRRTRESQLLLARGAPLRTLLAHATADGARTILPTTALAVLAIVLLPGTTSPGLWQRLALIPAAALLAPPAFTFAHHAPTTLRKLTPTTPRAKRPAARRLVAQAALLALCLAGLEQVRTQGIAPSGGINIYTACAPILAAALATLATLNVGPPILRLLLHAARRRRGAIGLLGIGRTARTPAPAAVTVFILTLALSTADLALALHNSPGPANARTPADPLQTAAATYLAVLAAAALAAGCLIVALAAGGDAAERRTATARLTVMGLTASQARGVALAELCAPIALAAAGGTAAALPLLWTVHPALAEALGGSGVHATTGTLAVPVLVLIPLALAAGLIGAALARRGAAGALRLGDQPDTTHP